VGAVDGEAGGPDGDGFGRAATVAEVVEPGVCVEIAAAVVSILVVPVGPAAERSPDDAVADDGLALRSIVVDLRVDAVEPQDRIVDAEVEAPADVPRGLIVEVGDGATASDPATRPR